MPVDLFFPVPLLVHDVEPAVRDAIQAKVSAYLKSENAKRDVAPSPEESVVTSYYRPEASILVDAGLDELEAMIMEAARTFLEGTLKLPPRRLEIERAWINLFEPGAQEVQHTHDGSLLSCSYYVEAPENCGCIVFPDPIGARRSYREFTKTAGTELLTRRDIAVEPQPGRLVMFESWMPHYVQCNKSDKLRISIAINLRQAPEPALVPSAGREDARAAGGDDTRPAAPEDAQAATGEDARAAEPGAEAPIRESGLAAERGPEATTDGVAPRPVGVRGKPFLFNELFDVQTNLGMRLEPIQDSIPTVVIDGLLKHPEQVRELVGSMPATNWKHEQGGRNFVDYYDCRLRFPIRYPNAMVAVAQQAIKRVFSIDTRPQDASVDVNWFMQINEKRGDFAVPHGDITENVGRSVTCIVYLNRPEESSGGTAFFRFKPSNSLVFDEAYARAVQQDARIAETGRDYWAQDTGELWEMVGAVDMVPGRMLIFPSQYFHAAYHPENSFYDFPRLTLAFWMIS